MKVLGLSGVSGAGKTEISNNLSVIGYTFLERSPADFMKQYLKDQFGLNEEQLFGAGRERLCYLRWESLLEGADMGYDSPYLTPRQLMEWWNWMVRKLNPYAPVEACIRFWVEHGYSDRKDVILVYSRANDPEDMDRIQKVGGKVLRVTGRGGKGHLSEQHVSRLLVDGEVNNSGTISETMQQVYHFLREWGWI